MPKKNEIIAELSIIVNVETKMTWLQALKLRLAGTYREYDRKTRINRTRK